MVNEVILNYLRRYKGEYPLESLKNKILSNGYSEEEFLEAINLLNLKENNLNFVPKQIDKLERLGISKNYSGFKWIKLAGFIGLFFILVLLYFLISSFFDLGFSLSIIMKNFEKYMVFGILTFYCLLFFFYNWGFVKVGKMAQLKFFKNISLLKLIFYLIFFGFNLYIYLSVSFNFSLIGLNIESISKFILISFHLLFIIGLTLNYLFSIALIKIRNDVNFSKLAGLINLFIALIFTFIIGIIFYIILTKNPFLFLSLLSIISSYSILITLISFSLIILLLTFESLMLFSASKKYEN